MNRSYILTTSIFSTLVLLLALGSLSGCSTTKFGGIPCDVTLDVRGGKPGEAFLIPYRDYIADKSIASDYNRLKDPRYYRGPTPAQVKGIDPYRWVYVVRENGVLGPPQIFDANNVFDSTIYAYDPQ